MNHSVMFKVRQFLNTTVSELYKCTWPSRSELLESTLLVMVTIVALAVFVFVVDQAAVFMVKLISGTL
ncbi:MAG: preprotein translocase subunit SecE [Victivallaceae bacterium]|nr:preprotein translocase subunit SecE [Victivallaceae bacterium]